MSILYLIFGTEEMDKALTRYVFRNNRKDGLIGLIPANKQKHLHGNEDLLEWV